VIFGDVNPAGRLPITFPRRLEDTPAFTSYPGERGSMDYAEGLFMGYRWYDRRALEPAFPFGHGLSYTEFRYGPLRAAPTHRPGDVLIVTCDVTNVGARAGQEVVQLYVRDAQSSFMRPERELRAFAKLDLAVGETGTARFLLDDRAFEHWDPAAHAWRIEAGEFELHVGASSRDLRGRASVVVK
jgi:beta-glucosidase